MHGHGESASQLGESDEQHAQAVLGVHFVIAQEPEVLEDVIAQVVRFVDDEHGELLGLAHQAGDFGADGAVGGDARAFGGQPELPGDGLVLRQAKLGDGGAARLAAVLAGESPADAILSLAS